jgi:hypothetical protein
MSNGSWSGTKTLWIWKLGLGGRQRVSRERPQVMDEISVSNRAAEAGGF